MGFSGISIWQLLIIAVIVVLLFGTKKLRGLGSDLGSAVKGFRGAMREGEEEPDKKEPAPLAKDDNGRVIDAKMAEKDEKKV